MLGLFLFAASFVSILTVTLFFPYLPPGYFMVEFFRNSETSYLIAGVSGDTVISAIINGILWSVILVIIYSFWKGPKKEKSNLPVWVPGYAQSRNSKK